jgi:hypothetical protein
MPDGSTTMVINNENFREKPFPSALSHPSKHHLALERL